MGGMGKLLCSVVLSLMLCAAVVGPAFAVPAFPGAEGAGATSVGGRDANLTVYRVTSLADSGSGTLREACAASGPRIVVFRVSGYITLQSTLYITNPYITIAGQTAPGGGICLKLADNVTSGYLLMIRTHDVIVQHLRLRPGPAGFEGQGNSGGNSLYFTDYSSNEGTYNVIVDHCSVSWGTDENVTCWQTQAAANRIYDATVQRLLVAQGLMDHSCGMIIGTNTGYRIGDFDTHHNVFMDHMNRNPLYGHVTGRITSNIIYNWSWYGSAFHGITPEATIVDLVSNKAKAGPNTGSGISEHAYVQCCPTQGDGASAYLSGNVSPLYSTPPSNQWDLLYELGNYPTHPPTSMKRASPLSARNVAITEDAYDKLESILPPDVGANRRLDDRGNPIWVRDTADAELVREYWLNTGHLTYWDDTLPWPTLASGTAYTDSDNDGTADAWEIRYWGNITAKNGKADTDGDGYRDLEEFLNVTDPLQNDSTLSSATVYATSFTKICGGTVSGTVTNVQASDDSYLVIPANSGSAYKAGAQFLVDTPYTSSEVSKIVVECELKTSRADTGRIALTVYHPDASSLDVRFPDANETWQTSDGWLKWETTDVSTSASTSFMDSNGVVKFDLGGCPVSGNTNAWDLSIDAVRVKVFLTSGGSPPVANFTGNPTSGAAPLTVAFTDTSTNSPTSWSWNFGDSSTSTAQNPSHQYQNAGSYTVTLTATNAGGSDGETKTNYITATPPPPVANFSGSPTSGAAPLTVNFTDSSTNTPTSWSWNFGDSSTSTAQNPSHQYQNAGSYTVTLTATNAGGSDGETKTNYITVTGGGGSTVYEYPDSASTWCGSVVSGGVSNLTASDNSYMRITCNTSSHKAGQGFTIDTSYTPSQVTKITVEIEYRSSRSDTPTRGIMLRNVGTSNWDDIGGTGLWPSSDNWFTWDTSSVSTYMDSSGDIYLAVGGCPPSGNSNNWDGYLDVVRVKLDLAGGSPPVANFSGSPTSGAAPLTVNFTDSSTNTPTSWSWNFGDSSTSTAQNPSHQYANAGNYTVSLTATNAGGSDGETKTNYITVTGAAPVANFSGSPTSGVKPLAVSFTDTSTNSPTSWSWNFGDSATSTAQNPSHTYTSRGYFTVTLTATNAAGSDGETKTNYIAVSEDVYEYPDSASTWCGTVVSGGVSNLTSSDNSYLRIRAATSSKKAGQCFAINTSYTPSQVSKITVEIEYHSSRSDTPERGIMLQNVGTTNWDDIGGTGYKWPSSDDWFTWETTSASTYMDSSGDMDLAVGGCPYNGNTNSWDGYMDVVRVKLRLNP